MKVRVNHNLNEVTTVETKRLRLILNDGKIIAVDTGKRLFQEVTLIELFLEDVTLRFRSWMSNLAMYKIQTSHRKWFKTVWKLQSSTSRT